MPYTILLRFDSAGACPVIAEAHEGLLGIPEPNVPWRCSPARASPRRHRQLGR